MTDKPKPAEPRWRFETDEYGEDYLCWGNLPFQWHHPQSRAGLLAALNNHERLLAALRRIAEGYSLADADIAKEAIAATEAPA